MSMLAVIGGAIVLLAILALIMAFVRHDKDNECHD